MSSYSKNILRADKMIHLRRIFDENNWDKVTTTGNNEFDDFCAMLTYFDDVQQDLLISLTENFLQIGLSQYVKLFFDAYATLISNIAAGNYNEIYILPLLAPKDFNKPKSSTTLFYLLKAEEVALKRASNGMGLSLIDNHKVLFKRGLQNQTLLCLVDDFIGSGDTAYEAIKFLEDNGISTSNMCAISLVAQQSACEFLSKINIAVYSAIIKNKGISDNPKYTLTDAKLMQKIESKMRVPKDYRFGYKRSEALIRLLRIPNNTFPIYWYSWSEAVPVVPFPRGG